MNLEDNKEMDKVDEKIKKLIKSSKGRYITQGVSFNKECSRQMSLLRFALSESISFSGLVKEMLTERKIELVKEDKNVTDVTEVDIKETIKNKSKSERDIKRDVISSERVNIRREENKMVKEETNLNVTDWI